MLGPGPPRHLVAKICRHPTRVLDELAIKIDHVERSIRTGSEVNRMEPWIGGSEEFFVLLAALGDECGTVRQEDPPMHQVAECFADKGIALICFAQGLPTKNR